MVGGVGYVQPGGDYWEKYSYLPVNWKADMPKTGYACKVFF